MDFNFETMKIGDRFMLRDKSVVVLTSMTFRKGYKFTFKVPGKLYKIYTDINGYLDNSHDKSCWDVVKHIGK